MRIFSKTILLTLIGVWLFGCYDDGFNDYDINNYNVLILDLDQEEVARITGFYKQSYMFFNPDDDNDEVYRLMGITGSYLRMYTTSGHELDRFGNSVNEWITPDDFSLSNNGTKICYYSGGILRIVDVVTRETKIIVTESSNMLWPFFNSSETELIYQTRDGDLRSLYSINIETQEKRIIYSDSRYIFSNCKSINDDLIIGKLYDYGRNTIFGQLALLNLETGTFETITEEDISFFDYQMDAQRLAYYTPGKQLVVMDMLSGEEIYRKQINEFVEGVSFPKFYRDGQNIIIDNYLIDLATMDETLIGKKFKTQPSISEYGEYIAGMIEVD